MISPVPAGRTGLPETPGYSWRRGTMAYPHDSGGHGVCQACGRPGSVQVNP